MVNRFFRAWNSGAFQNWKTCWRSATGSQPRNTLMEFDRGTEESARYLRASRSAFWQEIFAAESAYLLAHLQPGDCILSVGCGPAHIEGGLSEKGFFVVGMDVSLDALAGGPTTLRAVVGDAEKMPFAAAAFDVALFIVSLQFMKNVGQVVAETARVLKPEGRIIAMLLNPASVFFREKQAEPESYLHRIRHVGLHELEFAIKERFTTQGEFFLGIDGSRIFPCTDSEMAALYVIRGAKAQVPQMRSTSCP